MLGCAVFGVDRSPEMLAVAARNCRSTQGLLPAAGHPLPTATLSGGFDHRQLRHRAEDYHSSRGRIGIVRRFSHLNLEESPGQSDLDCPFFW